MDSIVLHLSKWGSHQQSIRFEHGAVLWTTWIRQGKKKWLHRCSSHKTRVCSKNVTQHSTVHQISLAFSDAYSYLVVCSMIWSASGHKYNVFSPLDDHNYCAGDNPLTNANNTCHNFTIPSMRQYRRWKVFIDWVKVGTARSMQSLKIEPGMVVQWLQWSDQSVERWDKGTVRVYRVSVSIQRCSCKQQWQ